MKKLFLILFLLFSFSNFADSQALNQSALPEFRDALPSPNVCNVNDKKQALIFVKGINLYKCVGGSYVADSGSGGYLPERVESQTYPTLETLVSGLAGETGIKSVRMTTNLTCSSAVSIPANVFFEAVGGLIIRNAGCRIAFLSGGIENTMSAKPLFSGFTTKFNNGEVQADGNFTDLYSNDTPFAASDVGRYIYIPELNYFGVVNSFINTGRVSVAPNMPSNSFTGYSFVIGDIAFTGSIYPYEVSTKLVNAANLQNRINVLDAAFAQKKVTVRAFDDVGFTGQYNITPNHVLFYEPGDFANSYNGGNFLFGAKSLGVIHSNTRVLCAGRTVTTLRESSLGNVSVQMIKGAGGAANPFTTENTFQEVSNCSFKASYVPQKRVGAASASVGSNQLTVTGANFTNNDIGARLFFYGAAPNSKLRQFQPRILSVVNPTTIVMANPNVVFFDSIAIEAFDPNGGDSAVGAISGESVEWDKPYSPDFAAVMLTNVKNGYIQNNYFGYTHGYAAFGGGSGLDGYGLNGSGAGRFIPENFFITDNVAEGFGTQVFGLIAGRLAVLSRNVIRMKRPARATFAAVFDIEPSNDADLVEEVFIENNYISMVGSESSDPSDAIIIQFGSIKTLKNVTARFNTIIGADLPDADNADTAIRCRVGIAVVGAVNADVSSNLIQGCGQQGLYFYDITALSAKNNTLRNVGSGAYPKVFNAPAVTVVGVHDSTFEFNTITQSKSDGSNGFVEERNLVFPENTVVTATTGTTTTGEYFRKSLVGKQVFIGGTIAQQDGRPKYQYNGDLRTITAVTADLRTITFSPSTTNTGAQIIVPLSNSTIYKGNTGTVIDLARFSKSKIIGGFTETYARDSVTVGNPAATETILKTVSIDERNFYTTDSTIHIKATGTFSVNSGANKRIQVKSVLANPLTTTTLFDSGTLTGGVGNWELVIEIQTLGDDKTQGRIITRLFTDLSELPSRISIKTIALPNPALTGNLAFQVIGSGTNANDVTANSFKVWKEDLQ